MIEQYFTNKEMALLPFRCSLSEICFVDSGDGNPRWALVFTSQNCRGSSTTKIIYGLGNKCYTKTYPYHVIVVVNLIKDKFISK